MNILLVEDHPIFRFGICQMIIRHWPKANICETDTLAAASDAVRKQHFDVALVDLDLPDAKGMESISQLHRTAPSLPLLVLSLHHETSYAIRALQLGAVGYLAKDRTAEELLHALKKVLAGGRYITATLAEQLIDRLTIDNTTRLPHEELSSQEYRVMLQLAAGLRISDIADSMHLSPKTISTYRSRILAKLGVASNVELTHYCMTQGLLSDKM